LEELVFDPDLSARLALDANDVPMPSLVAAVNYLASRSKYFKLCAAESPIAVTYTAIHFIQLKIARGRVINAATKPGQSFRPTAVPSSFRDTA
jgi:hypothetical protein